MFFKIYLTGIFYLAVRLSMPDFYEKMKTRLRTEEQGADTVVWLTISPAAVKHPSGLFFQGRILTFCGALDFPSLSSVPPKRIAVLPATDGKNGNGDSSG